MERTNFPFVHVTIDAVDAVIHDPKGRLDPEQYDRYATFGEARDAALSCVEIMLDLGDYDDEAHRAELQEMLDLLEAAESFDDLDGRPEYRRLLAKWTPAEPVAA